jgi:hypothetical protein
MWKKEGERERDSALFWFLWAPFPLVSRLCCLATRVINGDSVIVTRSERERERGRERIAGLVIVGVGD